MRDSANWWIWTTVFRFTEFQSLFLVPSIRGLFYFSIARLSFFFLLCKKKKGAEWMQSKEPLMYSENLYVVAMNGIIMCEASPQRSECRLFLLATFSSQYSCLVEVGDVGVLTTCFFFPLYLPLSFLSRVPVNFCWFAKLWSTAPRRPKWLIRWSLATPICFLLTKQRLRDRPTSARTQTMAGEFRIGSWAMETKMIFFMAKHGWFWYQISMTRIWRSFRILPTFAFRKCTANSGGHF
jgi:hypothetical protein